MVGDTFYGTNLQTDITQGKQVGITDAFAKHQQARTHQTPVELAAWGPLIIAKVP